LIYSVRWQLLLSMVAVILVTVGMTAFFANRVATAEIQRVQGRNDFARNHRLTALLTREYLQNEGWASSQGILEHAAQLTGERVVVADRNSIVVADSHSTYIGRRIDFSVSSRAVIPVISSQGRVGTLIIDPDVPLQADSALPEGPEQSSPSLSMLLILSGLLAVGVAMILTFFVSHRILVPIESLSKVSRLTAQRDFSARAEVKSRDEVGELARTFNSMLEELSRTEELRRNLVADVAHELRTPVTNIRGYIEGIADGVIEPNEITLDSIHSEIILLTRLIEDLQDLALAESGQMQMRFQSCDLSNLARSAAVSIRPQAQAKQVDLIVEESPALPVEADPQRISQALRNLLINAVIHTSTNGHIWIKTSHQDGHAQVSVRDTGPGIPTEDLPHIFERFYRVDKSRSRSTGGVGLGLTITKYLIEAHGGTIEAFSQPGNGTEFVVTIPRHQPEQPPL
jgi:signal transduction histidine kinase